MPRNIIGTGWGRVNRNKINENFDHLFNNKGQYDAHEAAEEASRQANHAKTQGDYAQNQGNHARTEGDRARDAADSATASLNTFHDDNTNTTYNWGLKQTGNHMIFMYEEV